jgi:sugar-specific transcriptional regulator TrmB
MDEKLMQEFANLGLTLPEANILTVLLTNGNATAYDISKSTTIPRTETYTVLSNLISRGVVFSTSDRPAKYYSLQVDEVWNILSRSGSKK